jgi:uncharacterized protein
LPLLIGLFGFVALEAVVLNKAVRLIVVAAALLFRSRTVPIGDVISHASIIVTLLGGSILGAWLGPTCHALVPPSTLPRHRDAVAWKGRAYWPWREASTVSGN